MHIDSSPASRPSAKKSAEIAVTAVEGQAGVEGGVLESWNDKAQETQFRREEDC